MKAADMDTDGETIVDQQQRQGRLAGVVLCACASAVLLFATASARGAVIVTDTVISETRHAQSHVPVTFGQVFKDGDVPKGASLIATLDGKPVTLQVDPKATNPDGSLRHAVITVTIPTLRGHAKLPLAISSQSSSPPSVASDPISLSQLLATGYDTKISLDLEGKAYTASARALLQAADSANSCKPWGTQCNVWLSGPLASEWVVNGPVVGAEGTKNPNLNIYFAIRAYAGATPGTVGPVRTDIIVENDWAYTPQAKLQYTATLTSGSANYTSPALTQHAYTRWHKVLWWDSTRPDVYLQQDTKYIQNSMAVSRYMELKPDEKFLARLP
ncbi:MAG: hypothetical protein ACREPJ_06425, partial [Rhodanobacteraceae bacterium]